MSNQKLKSENYQNIGGINTKVSQYQNTLMEFLDLKNFDFQNIASLTSRWGSTQYVTQTFGSKITALYEYNKLSGASFIVIGHSGGVWYGATTGNSQGMSFSSLGATQSFAAGGIGTGFPYFVTGAGASFGTITVAQGTPIYYQGNPAHQFASVYTVNVNPLINGSNNLDCQTFTDFLFAADGQKFFKFDGTTTTPVGLLPPTVFSAGATLNSAAALSTTVGMGIATLGCFSYYASYVNNRGFESQIWPIAYIEQSAPAATLQIGGTFIQAWADLYTPSTYGISSVNLYSYFSVTLQGAQSFQNLWSPNYVFLANFPVSGGSTTRIALGTTIGNFPKLVQNIGTLPDVSTNTYQQLGFTLVAGVTGVALISEVDITSVFPRYVEVYKDRVFMGGFSSTPSTIYFSDVGEPEGISPLNSFEVRTNDGDYATCLRAYGTRIYIFKKNSFHSLQGDGPSNYYLQELSVNYGCLNNNCAVIYDDVLLFLDRSGLMMYGGAKLESVSNKVQNYFDRINYNVALNIAVMCHDKLRNQILIAMPIDGSTVNNITLVYDYMVTAWTTYDGFNPTIFNKMQGRNTTENAFYGSFSGTVNWFGPSFFADNGAGFTTYFKTRFLHDLGDSVQKQYRRLYINADATGATLQMPVNFYQDYGPSKVLSTTFLLGQFQNRIDFGIPAKSLAFELSNLTTASPLRIYGFTIESRMQRMV